MRVRVEELCISMYNFQFNKEKGIQDTAIDRVSRCKSLLIFYKKATTPNATAIRAATPGA